MPRRTRWSSPPLAAGEVTALSSLSASLWPREAATHTGHQPSGRGFPRHGCSKCGVSFSAGEGHVAKNRGVHFFAAAKGLDARSGVPATSA